MPEGSTPEDPSWDGSHDDANSGGNDGGNDDSDNAPIVDEYANWQPEPGFAGTGDCNNLYDGFCLENCTSCKWQWPEGDPALWGSNDAACRCVEKKTLIWGDMCSSNTDGLCGAYCLECRVAAPFENPSQTDCRCKTFGPDPAL